MFTVKLALTEYIVAIWTQMFSVKVELALDIILYKVWIFSPLTKVKVMYQNYGATSHFKILF